MFKLFDCKMIMFDDNKNDIDMPLSVVMAILFVELFFSLITEMMNHIYE